MRALWSVLALAVALVSLPASAANAAEATPPAAEHAAHGGEHLPTFDDINWFYGVFGERAGVEPSFLFRPKGMPAPFGIWLFDALLLYGFIYRVAKQPVRDALKNRKSSIMRGMEEAARMKRDAEKRLAEYEEKLSRIEEEVVRVRSEMREGAEIERARILEEARARRQRMEADAKLLVAQELAAAADAVKTTMVAAAMRSAAESVKGRVRADDQQRLADEYLAGLGAAGATLRGRASA